MGGNTERIIIENELEQFRIDFITLEYRKRIEGFVVNYLSGFVLFEYEIIR